MARPRVKDSARVSLGLKISEADAARMDKVLTRPEFAGWTRAQWCREMIRTALRYYAGDPPAPGPGQARAPARPAAAPPVSPAPPLPAAPPVPTADGAPIPAVGPSGPAGEPAASGAGPAGPVLPAASEAQPGSQDAPEPAAQDKCPHPAETRDWQTGTCAACGAILWD